MQKEADIKVDTTREQLRGFLTESRKSQKQVAKEIGLSPAVISQFLSGVYAGDNAEIAAKVQQYLTVGKSRLNALQTPEFIPSLRNAEQVLFAASYAHRNNEISLVYGAAGAGKTSALQYYAENNPGVVFVTANACSKTARAVLYLIAEALGKVPTGSVFMTMRNLVETLRGSNRLIIIDEADHLTANALQAVRNLNDEAGVGLVLSGNDQIKHQMYGRGRLQFDQLRTRVSCMKKVTNDYQLEEIQRLFPELDGASAKQLLRIARMESLRTAVKRYVFSAQCANAQGHPLNAEYIKESEIIQLEAV